MWKILEDPANTVTPVAIQPLAADKPLGFMLSRIGKSDIFQFWFKI